MEKTTPKKSKKQNWVFNIVSFVLIFIAIFFYTESKYGDFIESPINNLIITFLVSTAIFLIIIFIKLKLKKKEKVICDKCNQEIPKKETDWFEVMGINWFIMFAPAILIIGLFFMGTLDGRYQTREDYSLSSEKAFYLIANITHDKVVMAFYDKGKESPRTWTFIWYLTLLIWIGFPIYDTGSYIYKKLKGGSQNEQK